MYLYQGRIKLFFRGAELAQYAPEHFSAPTPLNLHDTEPESYVTPL